MASRSRKNGASSTGATGSHRPSAKRWSIAAGGTAALVSAGVIVTLLTGDPTVPPPQASSPAHSAPQTDEERVRMEHGVPVGYPRTQDGAKAAAANFTTIMGSTEFLTDEDARHRAVEVMATEDAAGTATDKADHTAAQASDELRGGNSKISAKHTIARTGVFSAQVLSYDDQGAMVRLWTTTVRGSSKGNATPVVAFHSVTVTLSWESEDWKLEDSTSSAGLFAPIDTRQASNIASDFSEYVPAGAEDPVVSGATGPDGFPAAYGRDEQGAHAAASSATMLYGDPRFFTDKDWRHQMLAATAAPAVLDLVTSDADETARLVKDNQGLGADGTTADGSMLITRTAVLATRTISHSERAASIELWTASAGGLAGKDETKRPQVAFLKMRVDLVWESGTWKTTSVTPSVPLVPQPPAMQEAHPAERFTEVGGTDNAPATA